MEDGVRDIASGRGEGLGRALLSALGGSQGPSHANEVKLGLPGLWQKTGIGKRRAMLRNEIAKALQQMGAGEANQAGARRQVIMEMTEGLAPGLSSVTG